MSKGNIFEFPTKSIRDWINIKATLQEVLNEAGASQQFSEYVCSRMKVAFDEHQFEYPISIGLPEEYAASVSESIAQFQAALQNHTSELLVKRLIVEIELAKEKGIE
jgi:hypothetical protein